MNPGWMVDLKEFTYSIYVTRKWIEINIDAIIWYKPWLSGWFLRHLHMASMLQENW